MTDYFSTGLPKPRWGGDTVPPSARQSQSSQWGAPMPQKTPGQIAMEQEAAKRATAEQAYKANQTRVGGITSMAAEMGITNADILRRASENDYKTITGGAHRGQGHWNQGGNEYEKRRYQTKVIMLEQALQDNINTINNQFASLGRYGSPEHMKALARAEQATLLRRQDRQPHA